MTFRLELATQYGKNLSPRSERNLDDGGQGDYLDAKLLMQTIDRLAKDDLVESALQDRQSTMHARKGGPNLMGGGPVVTYLTTLVVGSGSAAAFLAFFKKASPFLAKFFTNSTTHVEVKIGSNTVKISSPAGIDQVVAAVEKLMPKPDGLTIDQPLPVKKVVTVKKVAAAKKATQEKLVGTSASTRSKRLDPAK